MNIDQALEELEKEKRNFLQSYDVAVSLKNINLKNPENKFTKEVVLPNGHGKEVSVAVIGINGEIKKSDLDSMANDKKLIKETIKKYDFFVCEPSLMPVVGKILGRYLAPAGRMPKPIPPGAEPEAIVRIAKKSVRIRLKDSPTIHCIVGREGMEKGKIKENIIAVIDEVKKSLPKGMNQVKKIVVKKTMSKAIPIDAK